MNEKLLDDLMDATRLKDRMRDAVVLVIQKGYRQSEAARSLGVSRQAVYRALQRVYKKAGKVLTGV